MKINGQSETLPPLMVPSLRERSSMKLHNVMVMVKSIALPVFLLFAIANIPGALAGGTEYADCVADCAQRNAESGLGLLMCPFICTPYLFA
ncbi:MAG: hypothetical protein KR126chlam2_00137 [Chlamydiae bacterium]|nr:hypothetical protein [Chlamydiota bacterium]